LAGPTRSGAQLNAIYSSDIGHFGRDRHARPIARGWELVEDGLITVKPTSRLQPSPTQCAFWGTQNPIFFEGTVVAKEAAAVLAAAQTRPVPRRITRERKGGVQLPVLRPKAEMDFDLFERKSLKLLAQAGQTLTKSSARACATSHRRSSCARCWWNCAGMLDEFEEAYFGD